MVVPWASQRRTTENGVGTTRKEMKGSWAWTQAFQRTGRCTRALCLRLCTMVHPAPPRPPPWASRVRALLHPAPQSPPQNLPPPPPTKQQAVWSATSPAWPSPWPSASHTCQPSPSSSSSPPSSASPVVLKGISGKKIVTSCSQGQIKSFFLLFPPSIKNEICEHNENGKNL